MTTVYRRSGRLGIERCDDDRPDHVVQPVSWAGDVAELFRAAMDTAILYCEGLHIEPAAVADLEGIL